jgi:type III secretory pathway component EscT
MTRGALAFDLAPFAPHAIAIALCAARLLPVVFLCPILGGQTVPTTVKLGVVLSLAVPIHFAGNVAQPFPVLDTLTFTGLLIRELSLGIPLGLLSSIPFDAARTGGRLVDLFRGSSAEGALPHAGTRESASGDCLYQLLVALACASGASCVTLKALFRSFAVIPLGAFAHSEPGVHNLVGLVGGVLTTAFAIAAPVAAAALLADGLMALASRAAPQMNLQEVNSPFKILLGAGLLFLTLHPISERLLSEVFATERRFLVFLETQT